MMIDGKTVPEESKPPSWGSKLFRGQLQKILDYKKESHFYSELYRKQLLITAAILEKHDEL